jgi:hypothetical protein
MFTVDFIAGRDDLSSYFLSSNDSNGVPMGRKLIRALGMGENLVIENDVPAGPD